MRRGRDHDEPSSAGARVKDAFRRVFGDGSNPFSWAVPLYTAFGIRVRIHIVFIIMILAELLMALPKDRIGFSFMLLGMVGLFVIVLLHEYGHCFACRWAGGTADDILMWPLGGLASCQPPDTWKAHLITTVGGPAVNVALAPVFAGGLLALGAGPDALIFNPFDPAAVITTLGVSGGGYALIAVWWLYYLNLMLLAFNVLVPMFPLDGGRILQELLWRSYGYRTSMWFAVRLGMVVAVILGVVGLVGNEGHLLGIAVFGGITCWMEKRRLEFAYGQEEWRGDAEPEPDYAESLKPDPVDPPAPAAAPTKAELKARQREEAEQAELDAILAKIARTGLDSLTSREREALQRATEKRRRDAAQR